MASSVSRANSTGTLALGEFPLRYINPVVNLC
jgi:hypothetical protein